MRQRRDAGRGKGKSVNWEAEVIALYLRVSTAEQGASDRASLPEQERICRGAAMMISKEEPVVYTDNGVSGGLPLASRPSGAKLWKNLNSGDTVIVAKLDRAFRSSLDSLRTLEEMKRRGVSVVIANLGSDPVTGDGISKLIFTLLSALAEFERFQIAERLETGRRGKRARGGALSGNPPYGQAIIGRGSEATLIPSPPEQNVIRFIAENKGKSLNSIINLLAYRGMYNRKGNRFNKETIRRIMRNIPQEAG